MPLFRRTPPVRSSMPDGDDGTPADLFELGAQAAAASGDPHRVIAALTRRAAEIDSNPLLPLQTAATILGGSDKVQVDLAYVLLLLSDAEVLSASHLESLGIDGVEFGQVRSAMSRAEGSEDAAYELSVLASLRVYDRQVADIMLTRAPHAVPAVRERLRRVLARFAADNDLMDLSVAYRLMCAECPEKLMFLDRRPKDEGT